MNSRFVVGAVAVLLALSTIPVPVAAAEDPRFETTVSEPRLTPGAEQTVTVAVTNDADEVDDRVKTATNVHVDALSGDTPFEVRSGTQKLGSLADGATASVPVRLAVPVDAPAGTYDLPLRVTYEYDTDERETSTVSARVRVPEHPVFEVTDVDTTLSVGERGTATVQMLNNGSAAAGTATLAVQSSNPSLTVEGGQESSHYLGDWQPGENRSLTVDLAAGTDAVAREYPISITPTYEDAAGIETTQPSFTIGVTPSPRQTFAVEDVSVTSYSETSAILEASISNTDARPVENALATVSSSNPNVQVVDGTAAAGTIEPGTSSSVAFELRMEPGAATGPRQFSATVTYDRADGHTYSAEPVTFQADVSTDTNALELDPVNNTFEVDETNPLVVTVTNTGPERVTDVHARLLVQPPYASESPSSYVDSLDPGESATLRFEVTTPEDGIETRDALPVVVNASTATDRAISTGPTLVPITVESPENPAGGPTSILVGVVVVVFVLVAGWWWLDR
ncbi:MAG: COG1361 S-layer family protein [Halanaeroarchaeum sp.]